MKRLMVIALLVTSASLVQAQAGSGPASQGRPAPRPPSGMEGQRNERSRLLERERE